MRGQGVGEQLLAAVRERLARAGIERIALGAACANEAAHRLYERHGFGLPPGGDRLRQCGQGRS
jgi:ribosomal protein S18 acetylase RimI-like enzyme